MKAIIFPKAGPIDAPDALIEVERPAPSPKGRELLVRVKAVSVNPVDTKVRAGRIEGGGGTGVLGWDASGVVEAVGPEARLFKTGDAVWYAGAIERAGSNAELQVVDERIVGPKPRTLDDADAAALPLATLTAWEMLFDRFGITEGGGAGESILIVGGAGGVGSIAIQLARQLTGLQVIASASRPETEAWVRELGAHQVIDHTKPLSAELERLGAKPPRYVFVTNGESAHYAEAAASVAPQGKLGFIVPPEGADLGALFLKSVSLHLEFMYTRHLFQTPDIEAQHVILKRTAELVDAGRLRATTGERFGRITADNLRRAHALIESGRAKGKVVLEGF